MKYPRLLAVLLFGTAVFVPFAPPASFATEKEDSKDGVIAQIRAVFSAQQEAWNHGDIDGFMNGYSRAETTIFVSGDEVTRGWQTVRDRYFKKYGDRAKMGTLTFADLEIEPLGPDFALALGRWELERANDNPHGRFTLIFRRIPEGWRIVHDHTSAAGN
jgi:ketosteroid isomerase-like protein